MLPVVLSSLLLVVLASLEVVVDSKVLLMVGLMVGCFVGKVLLMVGLMVGCFVGLFVGAQSTGHSIVISHVYVTSEKMMTNENVRT